MYPAEAVAPERFHNCILLTEIYASVTGTTWECRSFNHDGERCVKSQRAGIQRHRTEQILLWLGFLLCDNKLWTAKTMLAGISGVSCVHYIKEESLNITALSPVLFYSKTYKCRFKNMYAWVVLPELQSAPIITFGDALPLKHMLSHFLQVLSKGSQMTHIPISYFFLSVTSKAETFAARKTFEIL